MRHCRSEENVAGARKPRLGNKGFEDFPSMLVLQINLEVAWRKLQPATAWTGR